MKDKMEEIVIQGTLPSLNQMINAAKKHKIAYSKMKKKNTQKCQWSFKKLPPDFHPEEIYLNITYFVPNWKTDIDNVACGGKKHVLDGLVEEEIIKDDTHKFVKGWTESFKKDKDNPRIEITILEL